jgi:hypothetical protein
MQPVADFDVFGLEVETGIGRLLENQSGEILVGMAKADEILH